MADYMAAEIWIGGSIPKTVVRKLCLAIGSEDTSLEWGDSRFEPQTGEELLEAVRDVEGVPLLWLCYERARYGRFSGLELFLETERIPFDQASEGTCEFDPSLTQYRPEMACPQEFMTNKARRRIIERQEAQAVLAMFEQGRSGPALAALRKLVGEDVPPLPPFAIQ